jgi:hypothetical protein
MNILRLHPLQLSLCPRRLKFHPRYFVSEQLIEFFVGPASSLGLINPQVHACQGSKAAKNEGDFGSKIGLVRIEKLWYNKGPHYLCNVNSGSSVLIGKAYIDSVVHENAYGNSFDAETRCCCLCEKSVRYGANSDVVPPAIYQNYSTRACLNIRCSRYI